MQFHYQGVDQTGNNINGIIEASDRRAAISALAQKGHFPTDIHEDASKNKTGNSHQEINMPKLPVNFGSNAIRSSDILAIINQLATALRAGLPLLNCLQIIRDQQAKPAVKKILNDLIHSVSSGESLSEAMTNHSYNFKPLSRALIRVGETGGILEQTTTQLAELMRRDEKIKTSMKNASVYPIIVLFVGLLSVIIIVTWILPKIVTSISGGVAALPWPTQAMLSLSNFFQSYGWLAALVIAGFCVGFKAWINTPNGRFLWDGFKLKTPLVGKLLVSIAIGRFAHTLGSLTQGGITILESLNVVKDTLGNTLLSKEIDVVSEKVKTGSSLANALSESGYFPPLLIQITSVGEQSGKLDEMLLNAAETFDEQADAMITRFMTILPAIMILTLAVIVGFIVMSALLPIFTMDLGF